MTPTRKFLRDHYDWEDDSRRCYTLACELIGAELKTARARIVAVLAARGRE